jgi:hypothetical protein
MWSKNWADPSLDSNTGAHISREEMNGKEDYWMEEKFANPSEVYQVILKRRPDSMRMKGQNRINTQIKVQYKDPKTEKWGYYEDGALLPTGETEDTPVD